MKILISILVILFLTSCEKEMKEGVVIDKEIENAHTYTNMILVGKIMVPQTHYVPTSYNLIVMDTIQKLEYGKVQVEKYTRRFEVSEELYKETNISDSVYIQDGYLKIKKEK
jgi:hypothetical protein